MGLLDFFSAEAGQRRTRARDEAIEQALAWMLGPTGVPERLNALGMLNPVQDIYEAGANARDGNYAGAAINTASALMPVAGAKLAGGGLADDAANVISDTLTNVGVKAQGAMNAGQGFVADEFGGGGPSFEDLLGQARERLSDRSAKVSQLAADDAPVRFKSGDLSALVSKSPDRDGWRITYLQADGSPSGHVDASDKAEAVRRALEDRFEPITPKPQGIRAYHGSPHDFDRFSMDAIGTGEGAQAYGHGLYFAENEGVARGYRDRISGANWVDRNGLEVRTNDIVEDISKEARKAGVGVVQADEMAFNWRDYLDNPDTAPEPIKAVLKQKGIRLDGQGRMYEVRINADPDDFLDWDAPLSAQPRVAERLGFRSRSPDAVMDEMDALIANHGDYQDMTPDLQSKMEALQAELNKPISNQTGERVYNFGNDLDFISAQVTGNGPNPDRAATLREAGIPGIKYRDAGSRGMDGDSGTRNFVVFDENLIEIVRKYGIAGAAALTGMTAAEVEAKVSEQRPKGLLEVQ